MPADNSHIPPSQTTGVGVPPSRQSPRQTGTPLVDVPRRQPRPLVDPYDLRGAIARLAQLLEADENGPRLGVPRGFYLDILV